MLRLSSRNPRVAEIRALARQRRARAESGRFLVEGPKLVEEAMLAGLTIDAVFVDAEHGWASTAVQSVVDSAFQASVEVFELEPGVLERAGSTTNPQGIVAVAQGRPQPISAVPAGASLVLVALDINDPGNMGTLMRSAVAAGADAIVVAGNSVDVFSPKTVRSSAGAMFHVPVIVEADPHATLAELANHGLTRVGMAGRGADSLPTVDMTAPTAVVVGSEAHGLPDALEASIDRWVSIPMAGLTESLNVAMAATIVLYEAMRQRGGY